MSRVTPVRGWVGVLGVVIVKHDILYGFCIRVKEMDDPRLVFEFSSGLVMLLVVECGYFVS